MAAILRKYGTATASGTHIRIPIIAVGSRNFATCGDWTPVIGDVKLSKDGGAQANIGTLPAYTNGAWEFQLTLAELQCKQLQVIVIDSATKAIEDQAVLIETYGDASAMYAQDLSAAQYDTNITQINGATIPVDALEDQFDGTGLTGDTYPSTQAQISNISNANEIADAVWDEEQSGHTTAGTFGIYLDSKVSDAGGGGLTVQSIVNGVWDELQTSHVTAGTFGIYLDSIVSDAVGATIYVEPVESQVLYDGSFTPKNLHADQYLDYGTWIIGDLTDADGDDIDLNGKTVRFLVYSAVNPTTAVEDYTVPASAISTNQVRILFTPDDPTRKGQYEWKLYNITDDTALAKGRLIISEGPNPS